MDAIIVGLVFSDGFAVETGVWVGAATGPFCAFVPLDWLAARSDVEDCRIFTLIHQPRAKTSSKAAVVNTHRNG